MKDGQEMIKRKEGTAKAQSIRESKLSVSCDTVCACEYESHFRSKERLRCALSNTHTYTHTYIYTHAHACTRAQNLTSPLDDAAVYIDFGEIQRAVHVCVSVCVCVCVCVCVP